MKVSVHVERGGLPGATFTIKTGEVNSPKLTVRGALQLRECLDEALRMHLSARKAP